MLRFFGVNVALMQISGSQDSEKIILENLISHFCEIFSVFNIVISTNMARMSIARLH